MVTINDIAREAGVSVGTVSNVLNNTGNVRPGTREKVLAVVKELNYIPNNVAKALKTSHNRGIGILAEDISSFSTPALVDGICDYLEQRDYTINLANLRVEYRMKNLDQSGYEKLRQDERFLHQTRTHLNSLLTSRISGLIYIGVHPRDVQGILPDLNIPVVYTYCYTGGHDYCINYDDYQGARLAVGHLARRGHTRIALIGGPVNSVPAHRRMRAYKDVLAEHQLDFSAEYIRTGSWRYQDGYDLCQELLALPEPPDAIFAMSDILAYGAMSAARDLGLHIPDDLSIHGIDNLEYSDYSYPPLTSVTLPLCEMGSAAARTLLTLIEGTDAEKKALSHKQLLDCRHAAGQTVKNKLYC